MHSTQLLSILPLEDLEIKKKKKIDNLTKYII